MLRHKRRLLVVGALLGVGCLAAGIAYAAIPGGDGTIQGCYTKAGGGLRVVDSASQCRGFEVPISWNQKGPKGDQGIPGAVGTPGTPGGQGPKGDQGLPGKDGATLSDITDLNGLACSTGGTAGTIAVTVGNRPINGTQAPVSFACETGVVSAFRLTLSASGRSDLCGDIVPCFYGGTLTVSVNGSNVNPPCSVRPSLSSTQCTYDLAPGSEVTISHTDLLLQGVFTWTGACSQSISTCSLVMNAPTVAGGDWTS